jgi:hypothetical protein
MALSFYDDTQTAFGTNSLRTVHNGHLGGSYESLTYLRNGDSGKYYKNITVHLVLDSYEDIGELGTSGWGVKFIYGERRPTEDEWDQVRSGTTIAIPDIGNTLAADTSTYHPIWVRVFCPGNEPAQIRETQTLRVYFFERNVGA